MKKIFFALLIGFSAFGQSAAILEQAVKYLASDELGGRLAGSQYGKQAAQYIQLKFQEYGLKPYEGKYLHPYELKWVKTTKSPKNSFKIQGEKISDKEFVAAPFSASKEAQGKIAFVGYGIKTPTDEKFQYNSFVHTDLKNRIVILAEGVPEKLSDEKKRTLLRYSYLKSKINNVAMRGAKAVLLVKSPISYEEDELPEFKSSIAGNTFPIPIVYISQKTAQKLFEKEGKDFVKTFKGLDKSESPAKYNFLGETEISLKTEIIYDTKTDYNVIGAIYPKGVPEEEVQWIVLGAHYDHLDHGIEGSLARSKEERNQVHNGADDNASGTATIIALAEYFSKQHPELVKYYGILFCAWGGEELGLLGSSAWTKAHKKLPVVVYLNFDMVGRLDSSLVLQGLGSAEGLEKFCLETAEKAKFPVKISVQKDPYLPTDATSFYLIKKPVISFFTGIHEDYHRPTDDVEKVNFEGIRQIAHLAAEMIRRIEAEEYIPEYKEFVKKQTSGRATGPMRVYLGTMPDYAASDVEGMKISGVRAGSPAEKGGLQGGDIIIQMGDTKINNIYDYMYVLQKAKPDKPIKVIVLRDGKKKTLKVIPKAR